MKINALLTAAIISAAFTLGTTVFAAKPSTGAAKVPKSNSKNEDKKEEPAAKFDTNHNGKIDPGPEAEALAKAYEKDTKGPLKKYDSNHNGSLEKSEIEAIHLSIGKPKK